MLDKAKRIATFLIVRGLLGVVFGILVLALPEDVVLTSLVWVFGIFAVVEGAFAVMAAMTSSDSFEDWWLLLLVGLLGMVIGVFALTQPGMLLFVLVLYIGIRAVLVGVLEIAFAVRLRKSITGEWLYILSGIISVLFGLIMLRYPVDGILVIKWFIGIYAIATGTMQLILAVKIGEWISRMKSRQAATPVRP